MNRAASERLFIAINPPESVKDCLVSAQDRLREQGWPIRFVPRANLHLTLLFFGAVEKSQQAHLSTILEQQAKQLSPVKICLGPLHFMPENRPECIYASLEPESALKQWIHSLDLAVGDDVARPSRPREFVAHITLGRLRRPVSLGRLAAGLEQTLVSSSCFAVEQIDLMTSDLRFSPPAYTVKQAYFLTKHDPLAQ